MTRRQTTAKTTNDSRALLLAVLAALLPAAAWSQQGGQQLPNYVGQYTGRWSADCANNSAAALQVREDSLIAESGKRRVVTREPQTVHSLFGNSPPPARFDVALVGETDKAGALTFLV